MHLSPPSPDTWEFYGLGVPGTAKVLIECGHSQGFPGSCLTEQNHSLCRSQKKAALVWECHMLKQPAAPSCQLLRLYPYGSLAVELHLWELSGTLRRQRWLITCPIFHRWEKMTSLLLKGFCLPPGARSSLEGDIECCGSSPVKDSG